MQTRVLLKIAGDVDVSLVPYEAMWDSVLVVARHTIDL